MAGTIWIASTVRNVCSLSSIDGGLNLILAIGPLCSQLCACSKAAFHFYRFCPLFSKLTSGHPSGVSLHMTITPLRRVFHDTQGTTPWHLLWTTSTSFLQHFTQCNYLAIWNNMLNNSLACEFSEDYAWVLGHCKSLVPRNRCLQLPLYLMTSGFIRPLCSLA